MGIKRYALIFTFLFIGANSATAACTDKTCVDVFTDQNQLIITAQKGAGKPASKPISKATKRPVPKVAKSKPAVKKPAVKKPTVKKPAVKKPTTASLSDRLVKLLPEGDINFQPSAESVVNVPTYFWTKTPHHFQAAVPILDVIVYVNLYSTFTWSFGDGQTLFTPLQGGPFPNPSVKHAYSSKGYKDVELKVTWQGTWSVNGVTAPIVGNLITQSISQTIQVVSAPTLFNK